MKGSKFLMALAVLMIGSQVTVLAQDKKEGKPERKQPTKEQRMERQCNRIINELALDDNTAAKFSEVYKKYMEEMGAVCEKEERKPAKEKGEMDEQQAPKVLTDAEVEAAIKARFEQSRKMLDINESYYKEFRKFLSPKQIQKILNMENPNGNKFRQSPNRRGNMGPQAGRPQQGVPAPQQNGCCPQQEGTPAPQQD